MWKRVVLFQLQVTYHYRKVIYLRSTLLRNMAKMITQIWSRTINNTIDHICAYIGNKYKHLKTWLDSYLSKYIWQRFMQSILRKHGAVWWPLIEDYEMRPK